MTTRPLRNLLACFLVLASAAPAAAAQGATTWDGRHSIERLEVTVAYFVPADRTPLPDWRERVDYHCRRIERFHAREFQGQSTLRTLVHPEPMVSRRTTEELRQGDGDDIFFATLREANGRLGLSPREPGAFPILLVLSEINWRPLDDFHRLKPKDSGFVFEGTQRDGEHFPGAAAGGARATYLADRGVGWGLVSADGWRVPYRGSDCVVYHEGCGHTVGLPHPQPGNGSVMSLGQYRGWLGESWLDDDQKRRLGWTPTPDADTAFDAATLELFSTFRALPETVVPKPGTPVRLKLDWPAGATVKSLRVRVQTAVRGPWIDILQAREAAPPAVAELGRFDRPTPVAWRIDATLDTGATAELWGYLQVRDRPDRDPPPPVADPDLGADGAAESEG